MRVVLDTNSLLVSIGRMSQYRPIFDALINGQYKLLISNDILNEYQEIIAQKTNWNVSSNVAGFLLRSPDVEKIEIYFKWSMITKDADDNKFVDCALNGQADYLVTDDKHFNVLNQIGFPPLKILKTQAFLDLIKQNYFE